MKYAVVTGASTGIGRSIAQELAKAGWHVFGNVRKERDADDFKRDLGDMGTPLIFDVTDGVGVERAAAEVAAKVGKDGIDLLVNNAGVFVTGPLQYVDVEEFRRLLEVNTVSILRVTQAFLPLLGGSLPKRANPGRIINMSSIAGRFSTPFTGSYSASKFALESLSDAWRCELMVYGIDIVVIEPGMIYTPIWDKLDKQKAGRLANTAYAKAMTRMQEQLEKQDNRGLPPEAVSQLVVQIMRTRRPKTRYVVARGAPWNLIPLRWMSDRMRDRAVSASMGLS